MTKAPFFKVLIPFFLGILFSSHFLFSQSVLFVVIGSLISGAVLSYFYFRVVFISIIYLVIFGLGIVNSRYFLRAESIVVKDKNHRAKVLSVKQFDKRTRVIVQNSSGLRVQLTIYDTIIRLDKGDAIIYRSEIKKISNPISIKMFSWKNYWRSRGVFHSGKVFSNQIILINKDLSMIQKYRQEFEIFLRNHCNKKLSGFLLAMTLGDRSLLSTDLQEDFRLSGLSHLLAISGLHVGLIYLFIYFILSKIIDNRLVTFRSLLILLFIGFYWAICESSPSINRAVFMLVLLEGANLLKRKYHPLNAWAFSFFIFILINPFSFLQVGFQLSFVAVYCLIVFAIPLINLIRMRNLVVKYFVDILLVSLVIQISLAPLLFYHFHTLELSGILWNLVFIPFTSLILGLSLLLFLLFKFSIVSLFVVQAISYLFSHYTTLLHYIKIWSISLYFFPSAFLVSIGLVVLLSLKEKTFFRVVALSIIGCIILLSYQMTKQKLSLTMNEENGRIVFRDHSSNEVLSHQAKYLSTSVGFYCREIHECLFVNKEVPLSYFKLLKLESVIFSRNIGFKYKKQVLALLHEDTEIHDFGCDGFRELLSDSD